MHIKRKIGFGTPGPDAMVLGHGQDVFLASAGNDTIAGGGARDLLAGGDGNDSLLGDEGGDVLLGDGGLDTLEGGAGRDTLQGGLGLDRLTGGDGRDIFVFGAEAITDPTTLLIANLAGTGIDVKVSADAVADFSFGHDLIQLDLAAFGVAAPIETAVGVTSELGNGNLIVQLDGFANVALAASAIAANDAITADAGFFVYFNTTLGFNRLVYSSDLGDAGDVTVLANFIDQTGPAGLAAIAQFSPDDFMFV